MMTTQILAPAAVLVLWTFVMLAWMAATRLPALKTARVNMNAPGGRRGHDLEGVLPDSVNWKAHNYAHLHEQPTLFYAVVAILAIAGAASELDVMLAWAYVALRAIHSVVQATTNNVSLRFPIFLLASLPLLWLAIRALLATI